MKKLGLFILGLFVLLFAGNITQAKDYEYTNLDITSYISSDGTMKVKENITANFFVNKHGIIRSIPLNYSVSNYGFHIDVSDINVEGEKFSTSKTNGEIEIKIGDANKTVIGTQIYPISYTTYGLIRNFSGMGYAELYWNLVGYDFDTNINRVRAEIVLPKTYTGFTSNDFLITTNGSTKTVEEFPGRVDWSKGNKIVIIYNEGLPAYQGITLAIKFPNDYFEFDHDRQAKLVGYVGNNSVGNSVGNFILWILGIIGIIALFSFGTRKLIKFSDNKIDTKSGKLSGDFANQFPVIVQYEPPKGINSAEAGLLLHRSAQVKDMLSLIYKRALEGLITLSIEEEEGSFIKKASTNVIITKNRDIGVESPEYEKDFFKSLVRGEKSKIGETTNLYNRLSLYTLEKYGESEGWFNKRKNNGGLMAIGFIILYLLTVIFEDSHPGICILAFFGLFALAIFSATSSKLKETEEGARLISHILGYREFLAACDENKLRLFLQQDPLYFDKILPYAVAFGLDTELIKKIEPIMQEMNMKSSVYGGDFNYINTINRTLSSSAIHSVPPSASYSSSGGFSGGSSFGGGFSSGGGGGGGGGRSW